MKVIFTYAIAFGLAGVALELIMLTLTVMNFGFAQDEYQLFYAPILFGIGLFLMMELEEPFITHFDRGVWYGMKIGFGSFILYHDYAWTHTLSGTQPYSFTPGILIVLISIAYFVGSILLIVAPIDPALLKLNEMNNDLKTEAKRRAARNRSQAQTGTSRVDWIHGFNSWKARVKEWFINN